MRVRIKAGVLLIFFIAQIALFAQAQEITVVEQLALKVRELVELLEHKDFDPETVDRVSAFAGDDVRFGFSEERADFFIRGYKDCRGWLESLNGLIVVDNIEVHDIIFEEELAEVRTSFDMQIMQDNLLETWFRELPIKLIFHQREGQWIIQTVILGPVTRENVDLVPF